LAEGDDMKRRDFLVGTAAAGAGASLSLPSGGAQAQVLEHDWEHHEWGTGPAVPDRLYQGPFTNYGPGANVPGGVVVMTTTPSRAVVPNFGMGLTAYVSGDIGPPRLPGQTLERSIEDLIGLPFVQKVYVRLNWREIQKRPGRLDPPDFWRLRF
jgi:hypothetical protein